MSDLLPCPFCGSSTDGISNQPYPRDRQGTSWIAACGHPECHAEIEHATADRAIAAWNTRTSPKLDKLEAETQKLHALVVMCHSHFKDRAEYLRTTHDEYEATVYDAWVERCDDALEGLE